MTVLVVYVFRNGIQRRKNSELVTGCSQVLLKVVNNYHLWFVPISIIVILGLTNLVELTASSEKQATGKLF